MTAPANDGSAFGGIAYGSLTSPQDFIQVVASQSNRMIFVKIGMVTDVTINSVNIISPTARTGKPLIATKLSNTFYYQVWFITNPDVGSNTIRVSFSATMTAALKSICYYNANQADDATVGGSTFTDIQTAINGAASITKAVATGATDLALGFLCVGQKDETNAAVNGSETPRINTRVANMSLFSEELQGSGGSLTLGYKTLSGYYNMLLIASLKYQAPASSTGANILDSFNPIFGRTILR